MDDKIAAGFRNRKKKKEIAKNVNLAESKLAYLPLLHSSLTLVAVGERRKNVLSGPIELYYAWYNGLPSPYLFLSKPLNVPSFAIKSPRQHGGNLINQECPRRHAGHSPDHPESTPLDPFAQVMRKQHQVKETVLWNHVDLLDTFLVTLVALSFLLSFLISCCCPPDLTQLIVVIHIAEETHSEDHHAKFESHCRANPIVLRRGTVSAEPASDARGIDQLETERRRPDRDVDR